MMLALGGFGIVALAELILYMPLLWRWRKTSATLIAALLILANGILVSVDFQPWTLLITFFSFYRLINLGRILKGRSHIEYLYHASRLSSVFLIGLQLAIVAVAGLHYHLQPDVHFWWYLLAVGQLGCAAVLLDATFRQLQKTQPPTISEPLADNDLPALTVAVPARNETTDLEACLESLVASVYPKLEILVLDDCSQNKRTPEIIRQFAHDGVRFIAGGVPPERWLAKNYAYSQLAEAANGEVLLFCGVDARFEPNSLNLMVETLLQKKKSMVSFMPRNQLPPGKGLVDLLVQPGRYAWELALPRRWLNRPAVLSTCWLITTKALRQAGGFGAVTHSVSPESYLARQTAAAHDGYSFVQSDSRIGLLSVKSLEEQKATAIRTRYPQLHRRPEVTALTSLFELGVLVTPFCVLVSTVLTRRWPLAVLSAASYLLLNTLYSKITAITYRQKFLLRAVWLFPIAALYDIGLLNYSMWQYEFREVIWKGRNVCVPVMQAIPALPKSD